MTLLAAVMAAAMYSQQNEMQAGSSVNRKGVREQTGLSVNLTETVPLEAFQKSVRQRMSTENLSGRT